MICTCNTLVTYSVVAKEGESSTESIENQKVADNLRSKIRQEFVSQDFEFYPEIETAFSGSFTFDKKEKSYLHSEVLSAFRDIKNEYDSDNQADIYVVVMAADEDLDLIQFSL